MYRVIEPIVRPRFLLWGTLVIGVTFSYAVLSDSPPFRWPTIVLVPFVFSSIPVLFGMFWHALGLIFLQMRVAGELGAPELLPSDAEITRWTDRFEWTRFQVGIGREPIGQLATVVWLAPDPISWSEQVALTKLLFWRPLPALLIAWVLIGCMFFLAMWTTVFQNKKNVVSSENQ